jgi:hypothetical protein
VRILEECSSYFVEEAMRAIHSEAAAAIIQIISICNLLYCALFAANGGNKRVENQRGSASQVEYCRRKSLELLQLYFSRFLRLVGCIAWQGCFQLKYCWVGSHKL